MTVAVPPPASFPFEHIPVMIFAWISFLLYLNLVVALLRKKNRPLLTSYPVYSILLYNVSSIPAVLQFLIDFLESCPFPVNRRCLYVSPCRIRHASSYLSLVPFLQRVDPCRLRLLLLFYRLPPRKCDALKLYPTGSQSLHRFRLSSTIP